MTGHKALSCFVFLLVSLNCVIGGNEDDDQHLVKLRLSDQSQNYYVWSTKNELDPSDTASQKPERDGFEVDTANPLFSQPDDLENKVDNQRSTVDIAQDTTLGFQNLIPPKTNVIMIENVIITSPREKPYGITLQPELPKTSNHDEMQDLLENWRSLLVPKEVHETDTAVQNYVNTVSEEVEPLYKNLDISQYREYLWPIEAGDTRSSHMTTQFRKLLKLTLAYGTQGTKYYKDLKILSAVKEGLDFMVTPGRYDGDKYYGNWWDWQVGVPKNLIDIIIIIKDDLSKEKIQKYTDAISSYVPNSYSIWYTSDQYSYVDVEKSNYHNASASQQAEFARTLLGLGILEKNKTKVSLSVESTKELLKLVTTGNGFYQDGSFIHHRNIPYTGLFGSVLVDKLGEILSILKGSTFEIPHDDVESFFGSVENAFLPLIYRGEIIAPVNGLAISRSPVSTHVYKINPGTMFTLLTAAEFASDKTGKNLKESVKFWMRQNADHYLSKARNYNDLRMKISLLNDSAIGEQLPFVGTKMYASMDRFVQQTPGYTIGLSLYSERISAFEAGNKENIRGWHTADGAMYLYNYDKIQFGSSYWPTVDPYRLPGTTVDTRYLDNEMADYCDYLSNEKWVGGVAKSNQAVVGMALNKAGFRNNWQTLNMDLKAKKSWFVVEGQIIALGAGITGKSPASIETIVENRLLNYLYNYKVFSNSGEMQTAPEGIHVDWLLLESDLQGSSIGYYFPKGENVHVIREERAGTYFDINESDPSNDMYSGNYSKFIINHGQTPVDADYAYVVLPGMKQYDLKEYVRCKPVKIIENSAQIQAVEIKTQGFLGINVWSETGGTVAGISVNKPVSLMRQTKGHQQTYVLSDPTQSDRAVTLKIPDFARLQTMSEGIYYNVKNKAFLVDFTNARGASKEFTVYYVDDDLYDDFVSNESDLTFPDPKTF